MKIVGFYDLAGNKLDEVKVPENTYWVAILIDDKVRYVPIANAPTSIRVRMSGEDE